MAVKIQKKVSGEWIDAGVSENTACDKEVTIFPKLKDGDSCSSDGDCTSMLCKNNRCAAKAGSGKPCGKDGECESGVCKNECLEPRSLDVGASCVDKRQCKSGLCNDSKCKKADGVKVKNKYGGDKCMYASENRKGANVKFTTCKDDSDKMFWRKRSDDSYESAAYPGLCPRVGGSAC